MFIVAASVFLFPMVAYAEDGSGGADTEAYTETHTAYPDYYGYYTDVDFPIGIDAISGTLDFSAILAAILSGELDFDAEWLADGWPDIDDWLGYEDTPTDPPGHFTPDGTGTVNDNVFIEGNGLEFFTFTTAAGNVFYLIIDRTRETNNVFFLNAVTEWDLIALAQEGEVAGGGNHTVSGIPSAPVGIPSIPNETDPGEDDADGVANQQEPTGDAPTGRAGINGTFIFILIGTAIFGIAAYYFKIIRPKQQASDEDDEDDDESGYDDEDDDYLSFGGGDKDEDGIGGADRRGVVDAGVNSEDDE